ncbi:hypothetical protein FRC07_009067, partial [Ceratobasidium sp. 392]
MARPPRTPSPTRATRRSHPRARLVPAAATPPRRGVLQPVPSNDRMPLDRPRRLDSATYSSGSARKRKRRTLDENAAPAATRTSLKRRKSVVEEPPDGDGDDTDAMDLDSEASTHDDDDESQTQSDEHLIHRAAAWQLRRLRKDALVRLYTLASGPACTPDPSTELTKPELIDALLGARSASSSLPTPSRSPPHTRASKDREIKDLPARPRRRTVSHPAPVPASLSCDGGDEADPDAPSSKRLKLGKRRTVPTIGPGAPPAHKVTRTRSGTIDKSHPAFASSSDLTEPDSPIEDTPRALPSPRRLRSSTSRTEVVAPPSPVLATRKRRARNKHHHQLRTPPSDDGDDEAGITSADEREPPSPEDVANASHMAQVASDEEESGLEDETVRVLRNGKVVRQESDVEQAPADDGESSDLTELDSENEGDITMRPTIRNEAQEEEDEDEEVQVVDDEEEGGEEEEEEAEMEEDEADIADIDLRDEPTDDGKYFTTNYFLLLIFCLDLDIDLSSATDKSLLRLKRDALLRLCSSRSLPASGTKPQLVQALLGWRDKAESSGAP